jgi:hypothetical protein
MSVAAQKILEKPESALVNINQPFFNLWQAWIIKGAVCAWNTFCQTRYIQPKGGFYDDTVGGVGVFYNETIREWLFLSDKDMEAYNRKYKTGAKPRTKAVKKAGKK